MCIYMCMCTCLAECTGIVVIGECFCVCAPIFWIVNRVCASLSGGESTITVPGVSAACLPGVYVMGEPPPHPKPYSLARLPRGLGPGHLCPWNRSSRGVGSPPRPSPAPPTSPRPPPGGSGNGVSAPPRPAGPQSRAFPPRRPRGAAAAAPLRLLLPPFLLPSFPPSLPRAECGRGWEEISPEFPFHTSRLNFLSVSRPLAVCSFSCHRKCQAKVSGRGPAGSAGGSGTGLARVRDGSRGRRRAGGGARVVPCPALCLCKASGGERARVKVKARPRGAGPVRGLRRS